MTWNHSRGYVPLVAAAQRFMETHPDVSIEWHKRSLQEFADASVEKIAEAYDLLVIDHPWAGYAIRHRVFVPLEQHLSAEYLEDQRCNSVGKSHESYCWDGQQSAIAIDAATPVAAYRPDLMERANLGVPRTWDELCDLASKGLVVFPAIPIDSLMNFYMMCVALGEAPFQRADEMIAPAVGEEALELLRELASLCVPDIFEWNPIRVYEVLSSTDSFSYCPFAYGYSNYTRAGYALHRLAFTDLVNFRGHPLRSTLGGTGLAISSKTDHLDAAVAFLKYVAGPECQRTLYVESGGQPSHRSAWTDDEVNRRTSNFFRDTLPTLDRAYLRPRYAGYLHLQDHAGYAVQSYMRDGGDVKQVLDALNQLYRDSTHEVGSGI